MSADGRDRSVVACGAPSLRSRISAAVLAALLVAVLASCRTPDARRPGLPDDDAPRTPSAGAPLPAPVPQSRFSAPAAAATAAAPSVAGPGGELLRLDGRTLRTSDLGEFVLRWHPDVAASALRRVLRTALVERESAAEAVEVPAALVDEAAERALAERVRQLRLSIGTSEDPDAVLRRAYGRSVEDVRADLRRAVRIDLLSERLARLAARRRDGIELRVLVVADERTAASAAHQWRRGADGGAIARQLRVPSPEAPPAVAPEDVPDAALRARLLAAAPGEVLDPVPFDAAAPGRAAEMRTWWQVFKVVRSWKGTSAPWRELSAEIEASLRDAPATEDEIAAWEAFAARRAGVARWDGR